MTSRILVPIDFSDCSAGLVTQATDLARRLGAGLSLLHVGKVPPALARATLESPEGPRTAEQALVAEARPRLERLATLAGDVPVQCEVRSGSPGPVILEACESGGAEMIVMGTHGRTGVARVLLGSVAEHVIRRASVPVVTVRMQRHASCKASSCAVCTSHITPTQQRLATELEG